MATSLETIETQRRWKLAGVLGGFIMVIVVLFATEALMLSQIPPGERSLNPQPGEFAPYYP